MPLTIQTVDFKYKDGNGNYQPIGCVTGSVPVGGTTGQVLKKASGTDYDTEWGNEPSVPVTDVRVNGTSVLSQGVANLPIAYDTLGVVQISSNSSNTGLYMNSSNGAFVIHKASDAQIKEGSQSYRPIVPNTQHTSTFYGLAKVAGADAENANNNTITNNVGSYSETSRSKISEMLNAPVSVSGSMPSITAKAGIRYVCGTCDSLTITTPASGIVDVVFKSGSTSTSLTVTPPTGMTMKWPEWFDSTALEANRTYEINIMDGCLGAVISWT